MSVLIVPSSPSPSNEHHVSWSSATPMEAETDHSGGDPSAAAASAGNGGHGGSPRPRVEKRSSMLSHSSAASAGEVVPAMLPPGVSADHMETVFNSKIAFPLSLTHMLESVEGLGHSHVVCWMDNETAFIIKDVDAFLADVLPKFFKASENTKIRSFYRKLNRWGFSMSRKNSNNPNNIWRHPEFNRTDAIKALKESLETGKPIDFLNMTIRGKRRRELEASFNSQCQFSLGFDDDEGSSIASSHISNTSLNLLSHPRIASMPNLPMVKNNSFSERKRWQFGKAAKVTKQQPHQHQEMQRRLSLTRPYSTASNASGNLGLRGTQSMQIMGQQGNANASFDLFRPSGGASNANATFDLIPPTAGASNANATFDLSLLTAGAGGALPGAMASANPFAPSANIFAVGAQQMLAQANALGGQANALGNQPAPFASAANIGSGNPMDFRTKSSFGSSGNNPMDFRTSSSSFSEVTAPSPAPNAGQSSDAGGRRGSDDVGGRRSSSDMDTEAWTELTKEEDDDLTTFFGKFASTLPPPQEDDEENAGEPEPLPPGFKNKRQY